MAAEYTPVSLDDLKKYLKRAFGALPFKDGTDPKGEIVLDMKITSSVGIRVFTSVKRGQQVSVGVGQDAMRVLLWNLHKGRPLKAGTKALAIKRTQGWKDTLRNRIEDLVEEYFDKEDLWEDIATRLDRHRQAASV